MFCFSNITKAVLVKLFRSVISLIFYLVYVINDLEPTLDNIRKHNQNRKK